MQKKQDTTTKYLNMKISFKEIFDLQHILKLYFLEQEALAYKAQVLLDAEGEVARFNKLLPEYQAAPEVTRQRMYLTTMEKVYSNTSKVMVDVDGGNNMMYLPLDKIMQQQSGGQRVIQQSLPSINSTNSTNTAPALSGRNDRFNNSGRN